MTESRSLLVERFSDLKAKRLNLDLTRGKPGTEQVALSDRLDGILEGDYFADDGTDSRNYGTLRGLPEVRELGAALLDVPSENVICMGNSSLQLMHLTVNLISNRGLCSRPAKDVSEQPVALCPVPGYDRHFTLTDELGFRMQSVPMNEAGPNMGKVEAHVQDDPATSFIWCVPRHSNPGGEIYTDDVIERLAKLPNLRSQSESPFFILWDNAYAVHDFAPSPKQASIFNLARAHGTLNRVVLFGSTSKITHAGAGIAFIAGSNDVVTTIEQALSSMIVGPDKVNQLRHARLLNDLNGLKNHMRKHADIVRPKFEIVESCLQEELGNTGLARWTRPTGGYFVSVDLANGLASRVVELSKEAGLALTPAGATYPYGIDPNDSNLRIAPTYAKLEEIQQAMEIFGTCVKLAAAQANA